MKAFCDCNMSRPLQLVLHGTVESSSLTRKKSTKGKSHELWWWWFGTSGDSSHFMSKSLWLYGDMVPFLNCLY